MQDRRLVQLAQERVVLHSILLVFVCSENVGALCRERLPRRQLERHAAIVLTQLHDLARLVGDIVVDVAPGGVALLPLGHEAPRSAPAFSSRRRRRFSVVVGKKKRGEFCRFALPYDCREECNANTPQGRTARPPRRPRRDSRETCGTLPYAHMERELDAWTIRRARETRCVRRVAGARGISAVAAS